MNESMDGWIDPAWDFPTFHCCRPGLKNLRHRNWWRRWFVCWGAPWFKSIQLRRPLCGAQTKTIHGFLLVRAWEETSGPLKEFDPSQWSRGGPQWHRLVGRWCLCGWHLGYFFEKMHEDLGRMERAYWVYREHVLYRPKLTFDEVFFILHFFFFNCPRLVATLLLTKILSWWPGALYISKIVWPVRVSRLEGTLVTQLMPLLPSNNRLGGATAVHLDS